MGSDEAWEKATDGLRGALEDMGIDYVVNEGDGAFYGPKIDFRILSEEHGSAAQSSWICSSPKDLNLNIQIRTAQRSVP